MAQGDILPPPRTGPNYAATATGTATGSDSIAAAATIGSAATLTGAFAMIINDALFAASCKDLVDR